VVDLRVDRLTLGVRRKDGGLIVKGLFVNTCINIFRNVVFYSQTTLMILDTALKEFDFLI
jgi:hypothetical protein